MPRLHLRHALALAILVALGAAATAIAAAGTASFTTSNHKAGKATKATLDVKPRTDQNARSTILRIVRGAKYDPRAVSKLCTKQQANANNCPAASKVGGGTANATVTSNTNLFPPQKTTIAVDLFLAPPPASNDTSGIVAHFKEPVTKEEGHVTGIVRKLASGPFGYVNKFTGLDTVLTPPAGTTAHVDHFKLTFGAHRTVTKNGKQVRYDLLKNPSKCIAAGWAYQLRVGYPDGTQDPSDGSAPCTN